LSVLLIWRVIILRANHHGVVAIHDERASAGPIAIGIDRVTGSAIIAVEAVGVSTLRVRAKDQTARRVIDLKCDVVDVIAIDCANIWIGYDGTDGERASEGGNRRVRHARLDDRTIPALHVNGAVLVAHPVVDVN